jgi:hypothetical protein
MRTIETTGTVTTDGLLMVNVPRDITPGRHSVMVVIDENTDTSEHLNDRGWPIGFFDQTEGALTDDPLVRGPQGDYEVRDMLK